MVFSSDNDLSYKLSISFMFIFFDRSFDKVVEVSSIMRCLIVQGL